MRHEKKVEYLQTLSNVDDEINLLKEIKDIRDELRMIMRILKDQAMALSMMFAVIEGSRQDAGTQRQQSIPGEERSIETSKQLRTFKAQKAIHQMHQAEIDAEIREFQKMLDDADAAQDSV